MPSRDSFRPAIPFLRDIPDDVFADLDPGEWHLPSGEIEAARRELEESLNAHVMTYKRGVFLKNLPAHRHLCMRIEGAVLNEAQKGILDRMEARYVDEGVSFVAYRKPVVLLSVPS